MKIRKVSKRITQLCEELDIEIAFNPCGADIYWNNLQVQPDHEDLESALLAISVLNNIGICEV